MIKCRGWACATRPSSLPMEQMEQYSTTAHHAASPWRCCVHAAALSDAGEARGSLAELEQGPASLQVHNPSYDYVPPELISLFITGALLCSA
jgi:translation initiation factor 2B subunit (eIF-2B alpha/beta/delta family)